MSVRFGDFAFHADRRQLLSDGTEVHLTPKAFDLLGLLIERAPAVVTKADIHARLWQGTFVSDATLVGLVKEVRRALGDDHQGTLIRTAHRVGYAFMGLIGSAAAPESAATCWVIAGSRRIPLREGVNLIGRDADATVRLDVPGVSRRHAQIVVRDGSATLEDLGSKNGTLVGDRPWRGPVVLGHAARILVSTELIVFEVSDETFSTVTQPVPPGR